jgi:hypothetical protein
VGGFSGDMSLSEVWKLNIETGILLKFFLVKTNTALKDRYSETGKITEGFNLLHLLACSVLVLKKASYEMKKRVCAFLQLSTPPIVFLNSDIFFNFKNVFNM